LPKRRDDAADPVGKEHQHIRDPLATESNSDDNRPNLTSGWALIVIMAAVSALTIATAPKVKNVSGAPPNDVPRPNAPGDFVNGAWGPV
jgi:hypothetical protein